jgi:PadR family transcriptional regulator, regulatory protein PadR
MSKPGSMLQGTLDLLILTILNLEPKTGWAISQRLRQQSNEALQVSHGSLYPALHKLEAAGFIKGKWQQPEGSARPSKVYSLTAAGRRELRSKAQSWNKLSSAVNAMLESL